MRTPLHGKQETSVAERALARWGDTVFRVALAQTGSRTEAEDIYQDVFLKLVDQPRTFLSDDHLKAWLIRVTINQSRDLLRTRARRAIDSLECHREEAERKLAQAASEGSGGPGGPSGAEDGFSDLWDVVALLPEDQRTVVNLFYVEELTTREISRILECSTGAVRTRLYRAREALRDLLTHGEDVRGAARGGRPGHGPHSSPDANLLHPDNAKETQL